MTKLIRWGILGSGQVARGFAAGLKAVPGTELAAVASRDPKNAKAFAAQYNATRAHATYADLVRDPNVDVIYVATPHQRHLEDCLLCLDHNKAVLCEKPFTVNAQQAREVIAAARRHRLFCMEAMWMRFIPAIRKAKALVESGAIGEVRYLNADFGVPNQFDPRSRFFDPQQGGGALLDLGVYPLSLAYMLLGAPESVVSQAALGKTGVDDQSAILLGYKGGQLAVLSASLRTLTPQAAVITGSKGSITINPPFYCPTSLTLTSFVEYAPPSKGSAGAGGGLISKVSEHPLLGKAYRAARKVAKQVLRPTRTFKLPLQGNGYTYEAAEVTRCLRTGELESPIMPLDESLQIMETMDRVRASWGLRYPAEEARPLIAR